MQINRQKASIVLYANNDYERIIYYLAKLSRKTKWPCFLSHSVYIFVFGRHSLKTDDQSRGATQIWRHGRW